MRNRPESNDNIFGLKSPEESTKDSNCKNKEARSYHPKLAFIEGTKEILQVWCRSSDAYTSNSVIEFTKQILA
ncbi:hypothetical protein AU255_01455 [Methyloprofundus sedimenti]|uniref:Transposase DDE domain-containing protein n=1 Tax=Methyloprofundus sedimenti TaxID=1420851 RepID=A0A1V8M4X0_9GAMM|nr:hypothetical protein [Methyloprofundus sedimenti]OQK16599.1 hypothetical protein AU255_01455 [Methyloprofundus sedimenti]